MNVNAKRLASGHNAPFVLWISQFCAIFNSFVIATMLLRKRSSKYNCKTSKTLLSQNMEKFRGIREVACVLPNDM